jgi:hypothetical protein
VRSGAVVGAQMALHVANLLSGVVQLQGTRMECATNA